MLNSRDISLLRQDVADNCRKWLSLCRAAGLNVLVTSTVRDKEYQAALYEQGRTRPGSIVTNSAVPTFHWDQAGLAFDFCKNEKGHEYDDAKFFSDAAAIAKQMGFTWGGDWKSFVDKPHLQWDGLGKFTASDIRAGHMPPPMPLYTGKTTTPKKEANTVTVTLPMLTKGNVGPSVRAMQQLLNAKGFNCGKVDGSFGPATLTALKSYQAAKGLEVDGYCGKNTWTALLTK